MQYLFIDGGYLRARYTETMNQFFGTAYIRDIHFGKGKASCEAQKAFYFRGGACRGRTRRRSGPVVGRLRQIVGKRRRLALTGNQRDPGSPYRAHENVAWCRTIRDRPRRGVRDAARASDRARASAGASTRLSFLSADGDGASRRTRAVHLEPSQ
jgi:hypothetical protein